MTNLKGLASMVSELRIKRAILVDQLRHVDAALAVLGKLNGGRSYTEPRRALSIAARTKISMAQKARWAKSASNGGGGTVKPKRTISAAGRKRITMEQRARWAKLKTGKKTA